MQLWQLGYPCNRAPASWAAHAGSKLANGPWHRSWCIWEKVLTLPGNVQILPSTVAFGTETYHKFWGAEQALRIGIFFPGDWEAWGIFPLAVWGKQLRLLTHEVWGDSSTRTSGVTHHQLTGGHRLTSWKKINFLVCKQSLEWDMIIRIDNWESSEKPMKRGLSLHNFTSMLIKSWKSNILEPLWWKGQHQVGVGGSGHQCGRNGP